MYLQLFFLTGIWIPFLFVLDSISSISSSFSSTIPWYYPLLLFFFIDLFAGWLRSSPASVWPKGVQRQIGWWGRSVFPLGEWSWGQCVLIRRWTLLLQQPARTTVFWLLMHKQSHCGDRIYRRSESSFAATCTLTWPSLTVSSLFWKLRVIFRNEKSDIFCTSWAWVDDIISLLKQLLPQSAPSWTRGRTEMTLQMLPQSSGSVLRLAVLVRARMGQSPGSTLSTSEPGQNVIPGTWLVKQSVKCFLWR